MDEMNQTLAHFILKGISNITELQVPIFFMVLFIYVITLGGNIIILLLTLMEPHLQNPMYFLLCNLSFLDICYSTDTLHGVLITFISGNNTVSYMACMVQLYCFMSFVGIEMLILTAMSYDRYVAICNPLHYVMVMTSKVYLPLAGICWVLGFLETLPYMCIFIKLSCFKSNEINHFFCDLRALIELSCSDTSLLQNIIFYESIFSGFLPFLLTFISYSYIIKTILRIPSKTGRRKAFYTCTSHLVVVTLFYVTLFCLYLKPTSASSMDSEKIFSLLYTAIVPMLNPLIYSLKNKDVKAALKKIIFQKIEMT